MQEGGGGDSMHLLLSILADGEEQVRRLLGELPAADDELHLPAKECCMSVARQLRCTFGKAIAVAKAIEAAHGGASGTDSPRSADESSGAGGTASRDVTQAQGICKRRKGLPRWTEKFRIPDASLEYTPDDGLSWRKYGQKDILGAKFPRGYYRCTYRNAQGCPATKHVQRSDADLAVFDVTYQGAHTCHQKQRRTDAAPPPPAAAAARDGGHHPPLQDPDVQLLASFKNVRVDTGGLPPSSSFQGHGNDVSTAAFSFPYATAAGFSPVDCAGHEQLPPGGGCFSAAPFVSTAATTSSSVSGYFSVATHLPASGTRLADSSELGEVVSAATSSAAAAARFDYSLYDEYQYQLQLHDDDLNSLGPTFGRPSSHDQHGDA